MTAEFGAMAVAATLLSGSSSSYLLLRFKKVYDFLVEEVVLLGIQSLPVTNMFVE